MRFAVVKSLRRLESSVNEATRPIGYSVSPKAKETTKYTKYTEENETTVDVVTTNGVLLPDLKSEKNNGDRFASRKSVDGATDLRFRSQLLQENRKAKLIAQRLQIGICRDSKRIEIAVLNRTLQCR